MNSSKLYKHLLSIIVFIFLILLAFGTSDTEREEPPELTQTHRNDIENALKGIGFTGRYDVEVTETGWLGVNLHFTDAPRNPRSLGEEAVIAIRNELYQYGDFSRYRVSLYGPPPGPGLVRVYGAARFIEGGRVTWEDY